MSALEILTGTCNLWIAPTGTSFPKVNESPGGAWADLGETQDGVTVEPEADVEELTTDQRTGPVKAVITQEKITVRTKLAQATLENLARLLGKSVVDIPPSDGNVGTRHVYLHRGQVAEYALLIRGASPYMAGANAQYEIPRAYVAEIGAMEYKKDGNVVYPVTFVALEDLSAPSGQEFGRLVAQDEAAA